MVADLYDPATTVGQVRLLISDTDLDGDAGPVFQDEEIDAFLALEGDDVRRAAAAALDAIAVNEVLVLKRIETLDLKTDGPSVAKALREQAAALRAQADELGDDDDWAVAEFADPVFAARDRLARQFLRGS